MNDEAIDFKRRARRRLIGAIALVLFLVIVPPWVMEREPKPTVSNLSVEIPSQEARKPAGKPPAAKPGPETPVPKADEKAPQAKAVPEAAAEKPPAAADKAAGVVDPATKALKDPGPKKPPVEKPAEAPAEKPAVVEKSGDKPKEAERAAAALAGGYAVTIGTFANQENVKQLQAKLAAESVKSYTESVTVSGTQQTRVRAGPFPTREAAEKAREKLTGMGLKPGAVAQRQ
ncbi:MAG: SPOR domain-containing protein [Burkholderiales bacterium]|nr:SPOR domain-containing protein [Burkholderiales bacterium]